MNQSILNIPETLSQIMSKNCGSNTPFFAQVPTDELFEEWVFKLRTHRVFRQNEIAMYPNEMSQFCLHHPATISPGVTQTASLRKV